MPPNIIKLLISVIFLFPILFNSYLILELSTIGYFRTLYYFLGLILTLFLGLLTKFGFGKLFEYYNQPFIAFRKDLILIKDMLTLDRHRACNIVDIPKMNLPKLGEINIAKYSIVSLYTLFYGYVLGFLILGKTFFGRGDWKGNDTFLLILTLGMSFTHMSFQAYRKCGGYDLFLGLLFGTGLGVFFNWLFSPEWKDKISKKWCGLLGKKYYCEGKSKNRGKKIYGSEIWNWISMFSIFLVFIGIFSIGLDYDKFFPGKPRIFPRP